MMEKAISGSDPLIAIQKLHQRSIDRQERDRKKEEELLETGVIYLPTWREDRRASPNSFLRSALFAAIQSKDRADFKNAELFSQQGITVTYTGEQLNQEDMTVWLALVDMMKKDPLGTECKFTAHEILEYMDLETGGREYERLNRSIGRMIACLVAIDTNMKTYGGSLINGYVLDKRTRVYRLDLNRHLIKLFGDNDWTAVNWEQRKQLRRKPLCLKLHDYYSSHEKPFPVSLGFLSQLAGSANKQRAGFKAKVKLALQELVKIDFLKEYSIEGDMVSVERTKIVSTKPEKLPRRGM